MERISLHQFMMVSTAVLLGTTYLPIAQIVAGAAGRDGWWSLLPAYSIGIPLGLMILSLMERYPGKNLLQISEQVLGKWLGKGIGILYILISGYFGALLSQQGVDVFKRTILPLVPESVFLLTGMLLVLLLVWTGIEVYGRFSEAVLPVIIFSLIITMLMAIPRFEWEEFFPVLGYGLKPVFWGIVKIAPFPMEYILFLAGVLPFLPSGEKNRLKTGIWRATFLVGILNTLLTLTEIITFGPQEAARLNYGLLALGKMVEIAKTISGVESIFMGPWMGGMILKVGALFFMVVWGLETVFGLKNKTIIFLVAAVGMAGAAYIQTGGTHLVLEVDLVDDYLILPFTVLWIPFLWGVERWRRGAKP